jgi:hypothetical protein
MKTMSAKMVSKLSARLRDEGAHYTELGKTAAVAALNATDDKESTRARQHFIRAEVYKDAAAIIEQEAAL